MNRRRDNYDICTWLPPSEHPPSSHLVLVIDKDGVYGLAVYRDGEFYHFETQLLIVPRAWMEFPYYEPKDAI